MSSDGVQMEQECVCAQPFTKVCVASFSRIVQKLEVEELNVEYACHICLVMAKVI